MPKNLTDNTTSNSIYKGSGVFVVKARILDIEDLSNYPTRKDLPRHTIGESGFEPELCLKLKVDEGIEIDRYLFGRFNWKVDPISGKKLEYRGWQQRGNAVQNLLFKLLGTNAVINDDDTIPPKVLNQLLGQEFYLLRYCQTKDKMYEGKPSFQVWNIFEKAVEGNDELLYAEWRKVAASIKKYDPNLFEDTQRNDGAEKFDSNAYKEEDPFADN